MTKSPYPSLFDQLTAWDDLAIGCKPKQSTEDAFDPGEPEEGHYSILVGMSDAAVELRLDGQTYPLFPVSARWLADALYAAANAWEDRG
jgi:hypothetical protein